MKNDVNERIVIYVNSTLEKKKQERKARKTQITPEFNHNSLFVE